MAWRLARLSAPFFDKDLELTKVELIEKDVIKAANWQQGTELHSYLLAWPRSRAYWDSP